MLRHLVVQLAGKLALDDSRCSILAGIPPSTTALSVNRQCSSGLQPIVSGAHERLRLHGAATTR